MPLCGYVALIISRFFRPSIYFFYKSRNFPFILISQYKSQSKFMQSLKQTYIITRN